jgi:hypothetical protein
MVARETQDSVDLGWSEEPLPDTVQSSEQPAVPLEDSDDDEPTRVATSAAAVVAPAAFDALEADDIHDEGARVTEPGLAPPPPTSAEIAAAPRTAPPVTNPPPVELGRAAAAEPTAAAPPEAPAASIPPPPLAPASFTPPSLAPTAADWDELASPSFLATLKRTRPTSAWTGVGLLVAALTFVGGIGIGRGMNPPQLPPVPVPAPLPASVAAHSLSNTASPAASAQLPATSVAPSKPPPAPFDARAARAALDDAAKAAETCRVTGDPKGTIPTTVTFGSTGKVSNVAINSSRYAGTKTARCVADHLGEAHVAEFSGFPEALKKVVTVR